MNVTSKRLNWMSKLINFTIAIVLCLFLIGLTSSILRDIDNWAQQPYIESFEEDSLIKVEDEMQRKLSLEITALESRKKQIQLEINKIKDTHNNAKESFDNWIATHEAIGNSRYDQEVILRANELDAYFSIEQGFKFKQDSIQQLVEKIQDRIEHSLDMQDAAHDRAYANWEKAMAQHRLNVLFIRLAFILPIFLLGLFFIVKFRKHKYWPLFLGFSLFSIYIFLFGVLPYLYSLGYYVRNTVGILTCIALGGFSIHKVKAFMQRRREELKISTSIRAGKVQLEIAEKAYDDQVCPSCQKDFVIRSWKQIPHEKKRILSVLSTTAFCRFCGLMLFNDCLKCGHENFVHLPFCAACGEKTVSVSE